MYCLWSLYRLQRPSWNWKNCWTGPLKDIGRINGVLSFSSYQRSLWMREDHKILREEPLIPFCVWTNKNTGGPGQWENQSWTYNLATVRVRSGFRAETLCCFPSSLLSRQTHEPQIKKIVAHGWGCHTNLQLLKKSSPSTIQDHLTSSSNNFRTKTFAVNEAQNLCARGKSRFEPQWKDGCQVLFWSLLGSIGSHSGCFYTK